MVAFANGVWNGIAPPKKLAGKSYPPTNLVPYGPTDVTVTANRLYSVLFYVPETTTFAGAKAYNSGAADNGKKFRIGLYTDVGGPGALIKDFGEGTLTGASGLRTLASSVTVNGPQWVWLSFISDTTPVFYSLCTLLQVSSVGFRTPTPITTQIGTFSPDATGWPIGDYAAQAYGALPSTAPTSTNTIVDPGSGGTVPAMWLYV